MLLVATDLAMVARYNFFFGGRVSKYKAFSAFSIGSFQQCVLGSTINFVSNAWRSSYSILASK